MRPPQESDWATLLLAVGCLVALALLMTWLVTR